MGSSPLGTGEDALLTEDASAEIEGERFDRDRLRGADLLTFFASFHAFIRLQFRPPPKSLRERLLGWKTLGPITLLKPVF
jgi:hypothetical protein